MVCVPLDARDGFGSSEQGPAAAAAAAETPSVYIEQHSQAANTRARGKGQGL